MAKGMQEKKFAAAGAKGAGQVKGLSTLGVTGLLS